MVAGAGGGGRAGGGGGAGGGGRGVGEGQEVGEPPEALLLGQRAYCAHTGRRLPLAPKQQQKDESGDLRQIAAQRSNVGRSVGCKGGGQQWEAG